MSVIFFLAPAIITGWPAITAAAAAAATTMGLNMAKEAQEIASELNQKLDRKTKVDLEVSNSEVLSENVGNEQIVLRKGDMTLRVYRDERNQLRCCVEGENHTKAELEEFGHQVIDKITQTYIYNRVVTELKARGLEIQTEEVTADQSVHIHVRNTLE